MNLPNNFAVSLIAFTFIACSQNDKSSDPDAGNPDGGLITNYNPGFTQTSPNKPGSIEVTFSGELLGQAGLPFQPANPGDPVFVDGWSITFEEILGVVGNIRLTPNATQSSDWKTLQSPAAATKAGPFVMDFHKPHGFTGKDGVEPAGAIFKWDTQDNGQPFDTAARYAFSYDMVPAQFPAISINLSPSQFADYDLMVQKGWTKLYRGTAIYVGTGTFPNPSIQAKFAALPTTVHFVAGWNDHDSLLDCINPDFSAGSDPGSDLANRGIQVTSSGAVIAQITLHVDHFFWDKLKVEGTPLRFDPIAAWAPADTGANPLDITSLDKPLAATFSDGSPLPDRAPFQNVPGGYVSDQNNPNQVVLDTNGVPPSLIKNLADFVAFSAQSQMHLNADGLCYVDGQNPADPYYAPNLPQ